MREQFPAGTLVAIQMANTGRSERVARPDGLCRSAKTELGSAGLPRLRRGRQRAFTLIELLLAVTIISLVLSSVVVALHLLFQVDARLRQDLVHAVLLPRLSRQVRQDAHESLSTVISGNAGQSTLTLQLGRNRVVRYQTEANRLIRVVSQRSEKLRQEVFPLPGAKLRWELDQTDRLLRLSIQRDLGRIPAAADSRRVDLIEAVVGLNYAASQ